MKKMTIDWRDHAVAYIRSHVDANKIPGEWNWSCAIEKVSDTTCKVALANRAPNREELAELVALLEEEGFELAIWDRHKEGRPSRTFTLHSKSPKN